MEYREYSGKYYIRLDKGDELVAAITDVCARESIYTAQVQGIGGCCKAVVGVFDAEKKDYVRTEISTLLEMISLDGNITEMNGKPFLHAHASFAYLDDNGKASVLSGHLLEAVIGLTGEIVLTPANGQIRRRYDEELGIRVWEFL